jgi:hypothetical protein
MSLPADGRRNRRRHSRADRRSLIADADKSLLLGLLQDYQSGLSGPGRAKRQHRHLSREMSAAADQVAPLVKQNVDQANQMMASRVVLKSPNRRGQHPAQSDRRRLRHRSRRLLAVLITRAYRAPRFG